MIHNFDLSTKTFITSEKGNIKVEVGDSKEPSIFQPRIKLMAWDNECNISFGLKDVENSIVSQDDKGKIIWQRPDGVKAVFYDLNNPEIGEDGGYEFEVHLPEKPKSNVIELTMNIPKDLEFYYQPPLTKEEITRGCIRPDNVIGSYAVYHSNKKDDYSRMGGQNYKTGKAFHIYRPDAVDAKGDKIWCDLNIDVNNQIATITIPQEWLNNAVYPIIIDPTFGYTKKGNTYEVMSLSYEDRIWSSKITSPANFYRVTNMSFYTHTEFNNNYYFAIYSGGSPANKLAVETQSLYIGTTPGWYTGNISYIGSPLTSYRLCLRADNSNATYIYYDAGSGGMIGFSQEYSVGSWVESFTPEQEINNYLFSIYCTYELNVGNNLFFGMNF